MLNAKKMFVYAGITLISVSFILIHAAIAAVPDSNILTGKWIRPNGGYVLEIKNIESDGQFTAGYFNPRPIHVEKAQAFHKQGKLEVFIKLQDVNYPGSTYRLVYNPEKDIIEGTYFQAMERVEYQIYFDRMK